MILALLAALIADNPPPDPRAPKIAAAYELVAAGKAQETLDAIEPIVAEFEQEHAKVKNRIYCGMSGAETLASLTMAIADEKAGEGKSSAVALGPEYCDALYLKAYALIDLQRIPEAQGTLKRLLTFAPFHAHFWSEFGQSYRFQNDWPKMLEACTKAEDVAHLDEASSVNHEKGLAWRCMGYALIEQGKLDEAEALYHKCLALDPNDAKAKNELMYIGEQRRKPKT